MRLRLLAVAAIMAVVVAGCGAKKTTEPRTEHFSCRADIQYKDLAITADLGRTERGTLRLAVTAPETLEGLTMTLDGETVTVAFGSVSFPITAETLPVSGLGRGLLDALDAIAAMDVSPAAGKTEATLSGSGQNGTFTLTIDPATGALRSLSIPSLPLTATFTDFFIEQ